jgi:hypothetical protein
MCAERRAPEVPFQDVATKQPSLGARLNLGRGLLSNAFGVAGGDARLTWLRMWMLYGSTWGAGDRLLSPALTP